MTREEIILEKLRSLPPERLDEVLDFVEFLQRRTQDQRWIAIDAWAMNMAKERGFSHLTEEGIAQIVKADRREHPDPRGASPHRVAHTRPRHALHRPCHSGGRGDQESPEAARRASGSDHDARDAEAKTSSECHQGGLAGNPDHAPCGSCCCAAGRVQPST